SARPGAMTYRQQIDRLTSGQAWMMLALDLGMGPSADRALNAWQESFLPMVLQRQLRAVRIADAGGGFAPLVLRERRVAPNRLEPPPQQPPDLRIPLALAGLAYAALILALRRRAPRAYALAAGAFLAAAGFIGVLLACLWTLTMHRIAWDNANLLLFNPLAFALLPAVWRARRGGGLGASSRALLGLQLAAVLLAALLHLLPDGVQQNQPWLLFAICCWGALAYSFRGAANFRGAPA
ncbi:MAG TPA: hypothetical protein VMV25_00250, partial [Steroidobacteraceae bacterium]|nr:hypothetical protein [Steroidobacteraceae bacterium]